MRNMHDFDDIAMVQRSPDNLTGPHSHQHATAYMFQTTVAPQNRREAAVIIFCGAITNIFMLRSLAHEGIRTMSPLDRAPLLLSSILYAYISYVWPIAMFLKWYWLSTLLVLSVMYLLITFAEYMRIRR